LVGEDDPGEMTTSLPEVAVWFPEGMEFELNTGQARKANIIDRTDIIMKFDSVFPIISYNLSNCNSYIIGN